MLALPFARAGAAARGAGIMGGIAGALVWAAFTAGALPLARLLAWPAACGAVARDAPGCWTAGGTGGGAPAAVATGVLVLYIVVGVWVAGLERPLAHWRPDGAFVPPAAPLARGGGGAAFARCEASLRLGAAVLGVFAPAVGAWTYALALTAALGALAVGAALAARTRRPVYASGAAATLHLLLLLALTAAAAAGLAAASSSSPAARADAEHGALPPARIAAMVLVWVPAAPAAAWLLVRAGRRAAAGCADMCGEEKEGSDLQDGWNAWLDE